MNEIFGSVLIYLITFFSSIGILEIGQKLYASHRNAMNVIFRNLMIFIAVLIPSLLAGFRANSVGIDVEAYIVPHMRIATSPYIRTFTECCSALDMAPEYLYMLLVYLCSRITTDAGLLLFMIQFLTIGPIMLAALQMRKEISLSLAMATYLFCFYNNTLNMMRQSVSCAFILLGAAYLFQSKMKINAKAIVSFVAACFFHKSGIIGVLAIYALCKVSTMRLKRWAYFVIYGGIILFPVLITPIFELLNSYGAMSDRYVSYADIFLYRIGQQDWFIESPFSIGFTATTLCLLARLIVPCYYVRHYDYFDDARLTSIRGAAICGTLIYLIIQYTMRTIYGNRISAFFDIFLVLLVPFAVQRQHKQRKKIVLWAMVITFWVLWVMVLKWSGESHIYKFRF